MIKLDDIHFVLLSHASQQDSGILLPAPKSLKADKPQLEAALGLLLQRGFAEEFTPAKPSESWRQDETGRFGLRISPQGLALIDRGSDG